MFIINNNNNNEKEIPVLETESDSDYQKKRKHTFISFSTFNAVAPFGDIHCRRNSFVRLAYFFGWFGLHYFYIGKYIVGIWHCIFSFTGIMACMTLLLSLFLPLHLPVYVCKVLLYAVCALPLSLFVALVTAMIWNYRSDEEFEKMYKTSHNKN